MKRGEADGGTEPWAGRQPRPTTTSLVLLPLQGGPAHPARPLLCWDLGLQQSSHEAPQHSSVYPTNPICTRSPEQARERVWGKMKAQHREHCPPQPPTTATLAHSPALVTVWLAPGRQELCDFEQVTWPLCASASQPSNGHIVHFTTK